MQSQLRLTLSLGDYDINRALIDGSIRPQGIDLIALVQQSPQRHWRMLIHREFDACELSLGSYVAMRARGDESLVAIPVFPHRRFRHSYVFVNGERKFRHAAELNGGKIGIRSWQVTGGIWMRGFLAEHHGLDLESITWVAQDADDVDLHLPASIRLERVAEGGKVSAMCAAGTLDGLLYPEIPPQVHAGSDEIVRLFADPRAAEESYFERTGIFPIMHVVVIRSDLLQQNPWVARSLMDAFTESKRVSMTRMRDPRVVSLAWLRWLIEHERAVLGPDPWQYGLSDSNRTNIATFLSYCSEQGVSERRLSVDELFYSAVLEDPPAFV